MATAEDASMTGPAIPFVDPESLDQEGQALYAIVGMWRMLNTIHDSLHLPVEEEKLPYPRFFGEAQGA